MPRGVHRGVRMDVWLDAPLLRQTLQRVKVSDCAGLSEYIRRALEVWNILHQEEQTMARRNWDKIRVTSRISRAGAEAMRPGGEPPILDPGLSPRTRGPRCYVYNAQGVAVAEIRTSKRSGRRYRVALAPPPDA